jgi:DNA polymerase III sliding clamp (beta) subunit (PCNA family)
MYKETLIKIINGFNSASPDPTRYHLQCVQITKTHIAATDGHILSKVEHNDAALAPLSDGYILIHKDQLPYLKLVLKDNRKMPIIIGVEVAANGMLISNKLVSLADELKYPNIEPLIPKYNKVQYTIALDSDLLSRLTDALGSSKTKVVKLQFGTANDPVIVTVTDQPNDIGVLMPARM